MFNKFRRIFRFDENSLNSSSTSDTATSRSITTAGIYEDHPGLNPSSERIVELQSDIHNKLGELMGNRSAQQVLEAAEALHGESNNIPFLKSILNDLTENGVQSQAYRDALDLAGMVTANSPLEQFSIFPLIPMNIVGRSINPIGVRKELFPFSYQMNRKFGRLYRILDLPKCHGPPGDLLAVATADHNAL
ncbi:ATP synthase A chain [Dionaea muscipula]